MRIKVIDSGSGSETYIYPWQGESLMDAMIRSGLTVEGECHGRGTCGKCTVKVTEGHLKITLSDKKILSADMLSSGFRLACMAYPDSDCTVMISPGIRKGYKVVTETESLNNKEFPEKRPFFNKLKKGEKCYCIVADLGTTTLVLGLTDLSYGSLLSKYTALNPQRIYGTDVIARIKAANEGKGHILKSLIRNELFNGITALAKDVDINLTDIKKIVISGNTAMIHLLMGYSCEGLGNFPFKPYKQGFIYTDSGELFDTAEKIPVIILPAISAFVGGDIAAGLLACEFDKKEKPCLFIDLGTNGELALGNRERILVTSAPAGPTFEGGNISCGVGSIPGAICHVSISKGRVTYETIGGLKPVGFCGTGVIELISQLLKEDIIDSTGLLADEYFDSGYCIDGIEFKQKDIRSVQLAKAAVRAGTEILLKKYGITSDQLDRVYIAGGFGYYLDINKAADIGLLSRSVAVKTKTAGNTSLAGAIIASVESGAKDRLQHIISVSEEIYLSQEKEFNDLFIKYMSF